MTCKLCSAGVFRQGGECLKKELFGFFRDIVLRNPPETEVHILYYMVALSAHNRAHFQQHGNIQVFRWGQNMYSNVLFYSSVISK